MDDIRALFTDPTNEFRIQPFYFLNLNSDETELRRQIMEMDEKGIGGAVLHCRHGLQMEYMSEEWMRLIGICIDELAKRGMEAWLYDEDDWPSGTLGGRLTQAHPEFRMRYLRIQELRVTGGVNYQTTLRADDNTLIAIQAWPYEDTEQGPVPTAPPMDIMKQCEEGRLQWNAPLGKWIVNVFWECPVAERVTWDRGYYLDTMNPEAVEAFKQAAYEPYLQFKEHFGKTVKGIFTDEPGLMIHDGFFGVEAMRTTVEDVNGVLPGTVVAWSRDFAERFRQLKGYDLTPRLSTLIYEMGPDTNKIRCDYFDTLTHFYVDAYHGRLAKWAEDNGIDYIGHTLEDPLWGAARSQGNQMMVLEAFHRPGLDYLGHGVGTRENPYRILAAKCASSVAHLQGKNRIMCEAFGGSGHGHTLADRRLDANFMACLGVNMYIPHAFYYSFKGFRKTDWPPSEFYHNPYWPWYRQFADYLARLSVIGSVGHHVTDALVIQPMRTVQVDMFRSGQAITEPACQSLFNTTSDLLLRLHHDHDYADDNQLARAQIRDGRICFEGSEETYPLVVLPGCRVMNVEAMRVLKKFFDAGGRIIALGELPSEADKRDDDDELKELAAYVFGAVSSAADWANTNDNGGICVVRAAVKLNLQDWLKKQVVKLLTPDVIITQDDKKTAEDIICNHRTDGKLDYYLFVNRTKTTLAGSVSILNSGSLEEWDLETGEKTTHSASIKKDRIVFTIDLEPAEARLFIINPQGTTSTRKTTVEEPQLITELPLDDEWSFSIPPQNVLILDKWEFVARDTEVGPQHGVGIPGQVNTWTTRIIVDHLPETATLVFDDVEQNIPSHVGFLSRRRNMEIMVNGKAAPYLQPAQWQDKYNLSTDIADLLQEGENTIQVVTLSLLEPLQNLNEPVYLIGDFGVIDDKITLRPAHISGPFNEAGFPHFVGIATYRQSVELTAEIISGNQLMLDPGHVHDCCRILVNGEEIAIRLWAPFEVDITSAVKAGRNEIVIEVANSLTNIYDKAIRCSGLSGQARIWVVKNA